MKPTGEFRLLPEDNLNISEFITHQPAPANGSALPLGAWPGKAELDKAGLFKFRMQGDVQQPALPHNRDFRQAAHGP